MSDQCKYCVCYQNYDECIKTPCFHHEDWIDVERIKRIKELEDKVANMKEALEINKKYNHIRNDLDAYLFDLIEWALGNEEKPEPYEEGE